VSAIGAAYVITLRRQHIREQGERFGVVVDYQDAAQVGHALVPLMYRQPHPNATIRIVLRNEGIILRWHFARNYTIE
jgi:hypothetical protein